MRRAAVASSLVLLSVVASACSGAATTSGFNTGDGGLGNGGNGGEAGTLGGDGGSGGNGTVSVIYAHTDTELYVMDPTSHAVTDLGPFQIGGRSPSGPVTDLAVNSAGAVYVNTETAIYKAAVPASPGPVSLTLQTTLAVKSGQRFYALAFATAGVLGSGEGLVAGDNKGELWYVDTSTSNATPQDLGGFGSNPAGDPWELSGDLVFYTNGGAPTGLATIRSCPSGSCGTSNDSLAAIDMNALAQAFSAKAPGNLLKGTYGGGTGYGDLFGLGAWGNKAYGFARAQSGGSPAALVEIDGTTGAGTSLQQFPSITKGWSGAGVTTAAIITVPAPAK